MGCFRIIYIILVIKSWEVCSITTRTEQRLPVRNFRRHTGPTPPADWELGLREAVHQAFLRERHTDPNLRSHLLEAPIVGRQDTATPFGDIAVLARGQIYATPEGYQFVQDPYRNDCDDCHNPSTCTTPPCHPWKSPSNNRLLALWTVKRIRHRDSHYGHVFELEYTISPVTAALHEGLLTHNGHFNYAVPGHVFVIRSDPQLNSAYYMNNNAEKHQQITNKWYGKQESAQFPGVHRATSAHQNQDQYKGSGHFKPGILIGVSPDGYKHVLHSFPGFFSSYQPQIFNDQTTIDPKEYELYKKLIESLASKTTPQNGYSRPPHRFGLTPSTSEKAPPATIPTYQQVPTFVPIPQTTLGQIPSELFPSLTSTTIDYQNLNFPVRLPTSQQEATYVFSPTTTTGKQTLPTVSTTKGSERPFYREEKLTTRPKPMTGPITTIHYYSPVEEASSSLQETVGTASTTSSKRPEMQIISTGNMKSTTIFASTSKIPEVTSGFTKPTTTERDDSFELFSDTEFIPMVSKTTKKGIIKQTTSRPLSTSSEDDGLDLFPNEPTEPMTLATQAPTKVHSDSINEQLPTPEKNSDTTIPYMTSPTEPSVIKTTEINKVSSTSLAESTKTPEGDLELTTQHHSEAPASSLGVNPRTEPLSTVKDYTTSQLPTTEELRVVTTKVPTTIVTSHESNGDDYKISTTQHVSTATFPISTITEEPITSKGSTFSTVETTKTNNEFTNEFPEVTKMIDTTSEWTKLTTERFTNSLAQDSSKTTTEMLSTNKLTTSTLPESTKLTTNAVSTILASTITTMDRLPTTLAEWTKLTTDGVLNTTPESTKTTKIVTTPLETTILTQTTPVQTTTKYPTTATVTKKHGTKPQVTQSDDFLADSGNQKVDATSKKDVSDDDIFGEKPPEPVRKPTKLPVKKVPQNDLEQALFGGRRAKQIKLFSKLEATKAGTNPPRVIYSNFYVPSTELPTSHFADLENNADTTRAFYETTTNFNSATEFRPVTDQSYATSISFEVNRRNQMSPPPLHLTSIKAKLSEVVNSKGDYKIFKAELPAGEKELSNSREKVETKKVFDDLALQLVNHARTIDYLNRKPSKRPKYRKRNYVPKTRRNQRKL